jgi:hypothetical protein
MCRRSTQHIVHAIGLGWRDGAVERVGIGRRRIDLETTFHAARRAVEHRHAVKQVCPIPHMDREARRIERRRQRRGHLEPMLHLALDAQRRQPGQQRRGPGAGAQDQAVGGKRAARRADAAAAAGIGPFEDRRVEAQRRPVLRCQAQMQRHHAFGIDHAGARVEAGVHCIGHRDRGRAFS